MSQCSVDVGAATMVSELNRGTIRFEKYVDLAKVFREAQA
jgi:hypothetical protein